MADLATAGKRRQAPPVDSRLTTRRSPPRVGIATGWVQALGVLGFFLLWEALTRFGVLPALLFPAPTTIARTLWGSIASGQMTAELGATLLRVVPGFALGGIAGLTLGLAMGWSRRARKFADPFVAAVHPIPKIALLPLIMLVFGIGEVSKIVLVAIAAFFPMVINTMAGVRQVSPLYFDVAESYGATPRHVFTRVVFPGSLPLALSGARLSVNVAFLVTIAVEIVSAERGLGALLWLSWEILRVDLLYAALVVISVFGILLNVGLQKLTARIVPWQADHSKTR